MDNQKPALRGNISCVRRCSWWFYSGVTGGHQRMQQFLSKETPIDRYQGSLPDAVRTVIAATKSCRRQPCAVHSNDSVALALIVGRIPSRMSNVVTALSWKHRATTSRIGEDQLFTACNARISEDAISMIVNGFARRVLGLPGIAVGTKLLAIDLEHIGQE